MSITFDEHSVFTWKSNVLVWLSIINKLHSYLMTVNEASSSKICRCLCFFLLSDWRTECGCFRGTFFRLSSPICSGFRPSTRWCCCPSPSVASSSCLTWSTLKKLGEPHGNLVRPCQPNSRTAGSAPVWPLPESVSAPNLKLKGRKYRCVRVRDSEGLGTIEHPSCQSQTKWWAFY